MSRTVRGVLDRREGELAVVHLPGGPLDLPEWMIPAGAADGEALLFSAEATESVVRLEVRLGRGGSDDPRARAAAAQERLRARRA